MGGLFGIGTFQPTSGGTQVDSGFPTQPFQLFNPYSGFYGGTYGFVLDTRIRAPQQVVWTPAPEVGLDPTGVSVVRGYPQVTWSYTTLRPDYWYYLYQAYLQAARTIAAYQYLVLLQYPDPLAGGAIVQNLARWDPPTMQNRTIGAFVGVTLTFTYVGIATLSSATPVVVLS